jgi:hypothetical protein
MPPQRHWRSYGNEPLTAPAEADILKGSSVVFWNVSKA